MSVPAAPYPRKTCATVTLLRGWRTLRHVSPRRLASPGRSPLPALPPVHRRPLLNPRLALPKGLEQRRRRSVRLRESRAEPDVGGILLLRRGAGAGNRSALFRRAGNIPLFAPLARGRTVGYLPPYKHLQPTVAALSGFATAPDCEPSRLPVPESLTLGAGSFVGREGSRCLPSKNEQSGGMSPALRQRTQPIVSLYQALQLSGDCRLWAMLSARSRTSDCRVSTASSVDLPTDFCS